MKLKRKNLLKKIEDRIKNVIYNITLDSYINYDICYSFDSKRMKLILSYYEGYFRENMVSIFVDFNNVKFVSNYVLRNTEDILNNKTLIFDNENNIGEKLKKILLLRYYICKNYK